MLKLDALNGADVGKEYCNDKAAAIFAHHIAEVEGERLIEQVEAADFVSLIFDGSTDASVIEQEMIYIHTCKSGEPSVNFLGVIGTPKADSIGVT